MRRLPLLAALLFLTACGGGSGDSGGESALNQTPAFPNPTRAAQPWTTQAWAVSTMAPGLEARWELEFIGDGRILRLAPRT